MKGWDVFWCREDPFNQKEEQEHHDQEWKRLIQRWMKHWKRHPHILKLLSSKHPKTTIGLWI